MRAPVYVHAVHCWVMRLFKSWRFARTAPLFAIVSLLCLLCFGAFLSLLPTGLEVRAVLTKAYSSQVNQTTSGDQPPLEGSYLAVPPDETEEVGKQPVNAERLSVLLLIALSFGATVVWLLGLCAPKEQFPAPQTPKVKEGPSAQRIPAHAPSVKVAAQDTQEEDVLRRLCP